MASRIGAPDVLEPVELPVPQPKPDELRVDVHVIGVTWMDTQIRMGKGPAVYAAEPPFIPGGAVAGSVGAIGTRVDRGWLGTRVVARANGGGYVQNAICSPENTFRVPDGLDLQDAMALMDDGSTALALLEKTPVGAGDRVLVAPGVGGLGHVLVQLALAAGATVVAAVRGAEKLAAARSLGAEAVDYSVPNWPDQVRQIADGGVEAAYDGVGGAIGAASVDLLVDGGRFSGYGMTSGAQTTIGAADRQRLTVCDMSQLPEFWSDNPRRVQQILREAAAGRVRPLIGQTYPLAEAVRAHEDIEARRFIGKSLLLP
ncbi:NADPH:quinone reductase-like Zn-dependent oxidoreductase [Thermomonospora umbrina]|uniref:NADPH:quinone reductase-like Zn-dependent oxidoreductase n=2 Tax=Thermomonospora umbrina TaxID=111806 RepID=A0A3D9SHB5_9ACTN|nr:NADPH:quinone reductase-like Zn-dependent oxidoreductase [Thermomonospora umbrina]